MHTGEITINVNSKKMENTVDRQDLDKIVLFHVALINKQRVDVYMQSMESGILVIAKYCEQNQLCQSEHLRFIASKYDFCAIQNGS